MRYGKKKHFERFQLPGIFHPALSNLAEDIKDQRNVFSTQN